MAGRPRSQCVFGFDVIELSDALEALEREAGAFNEVEVERLLQSAGGVAAAIEAVRRALSYRRCGESAPARQRGEGKIELVESADGQVTGHILGATSGAGPRRLVVRESSAWSHDATSFVFDHLDTARYSTFNLKKALCRLRTFLWCPSRSLWGVYPIDV